MKKYSESFASLPVLRLTVFMLHYCSAVVDVPFETLVMPVCSVLSAAAVAADAALCAVVAVSGAESERTALI